MNYPVAMGNDELAGQYGGIRAIPTTFILDKDLNVVEKVMGYRPKEFFEEKISKLLKK
jgi:cytochrome c biogenesis protein CcmG/thiol:disulfide interchange protein DsbE